MPSDSNQVPPDGFPDPLAVLRDSAWLRGIPGLADAAVEWHAALLPERDELHGTADRLARPRFKPTLALRAGEVGLHAANAGRKIAYRRLSGDITGVEVARDLRRAFEALGPTYIKLGQLLASSAGLVPADVADEFGKCRDAVPADDWDVVKGQLRRELGDIDAVFAEIDEAPLASASIAQVHAATLHDGRDVVVKVRHPRTRRRFYADISIMAWSADLLERISRVGIANPRAFVQLFARQVVEELDLRLEALNMCEIGASIEHAGLDYVLCPRPLPDLVTSRVIVMERLDGIPYSAISEIRASGVDTERLVTLGIKAVLEGTFVYGVFHGDLHAGNLLVCPPDKFGLLDYGIVGRLSPGQRLALVRCACAVGSGDVRGQIEAMRAYDAFPAGADLEPMITDLETHQERIENELLAGAEDFALDDLANAVAVVVDELGAHGFRMPPELALFSKNLLYLNSSILTLAPRLDLTEALGPIMVSLAMRYGNLFIDVIQVDMGGVARRDDIAHDVAPRLRHGRLGHQLGGRAGLDD